MSGFSRTKSGPNRKQAFAFGSGPRTPHAGARRKALVTGDASAPERAPVRGHPLRFRFVHGVRLQADQEWRLVCLRTILVGAKVEIASMTRAISAAKEDLIAASRQVKLPIATSVVPIGKRRA